MEILSEILEGEVDRNYGDVNMCLPNHPLAISAHVSQDRLSDPGIPGVVSKGPCPR